MKNRCLGTEQKQEQWSLHVRVRAQKNHADTAAPVPERSNDDTCMSGMRCNTHLL